MKRIAVMTAVILLTLAVLALASQVRTVLLIFLISLVIGATLDGPIQRLMGWGLSRRWSILMVYLWLVALILLLVAVVAIPVVNETNLFVVDLTQEYNRLRFYLRSLTGTQIDLLAAVLPTDEQFSVGVEQGVMTPALRRAIGITQDLGILLGQFALALVLSVYWTVDRTRFERLWLSLLAPEYRTHTRAMMARLTVQVGAYIRSEVYQSMLAGVLLALGFWIIGFKYPVTAAVLAAIAWLIPLVGGLVALILVLIVGWMNDPVTMGIGALYTLVVLLFMEVLVERRLFGAERYWGVLVTFVMLAFGSEFGLVGLIIAPPIAVALQVIIDSLLTYTPSKQLDASPDPVELRRRLDSIEAELGSSGTARSPRLESLAARIRDILDSEEILHSSSAEDSAARVSVSPAVMGGTGGAVNTTQ